MRLTCPARLLATVAVSLSFGVAPSLMPGSALADARRAAQTGTDTPGIDPDAYDCDQPSLVDFEDFEDGQDLTKNSFGGVHFTTTGGYTWNAGDWDSGNYSGKYPDRGHYTSQGTHWAWLGPDQGSGRIDFTNGAASTISILVSENTPVQMDAYSSSDELLATAGPVEPNINTGTVDELRVSGGQSNIAYVVLHDDGNFFAVDDVCTDAPGVVARTDRYVALGDSIPYGHGLVNPTDGVKGALPSNQPPSGKAYPSLVDSALGFRTFNQRPTGCDLTGNGLYDNLAVSGAASQKNKWTGTDDDCKYSNGSDRLHKVVAPDELQAAGFTADPPALVTVQVGADDIRFGGCLSAVLGLPAQAGAHNCINTTNHGYELRDEAKAELRSLAAGLQRIIRRVHTDSPSTQIMVLNYYQIIPAAGVRVTGSSLLCRNLRAAAPRSQYRKSIRAQADFVQARLNGTINDAVSGYNDVRLVKLGGTFAGHELCTLHSWLFDAKWSAAHPNAKGQREIARRVEAKCQTLARECHGK